MLGVLSGCFCLQRGHALLRPNTHSRVSGKPALCETNYRPAGVSAHPAVADSLFDSGKRGEVAVRRQALSSKNSVPEHQNLLTNHAVSAPLLPPRLALGRVVLRLCFLCALPYAE